MEKLTSYQKQKQRILELERDLQVVCTSPTHPQATEIIERVKFNVKWGDIVYMGNPNGDGKGLINQIYDFSKLEVTPMNGDFMSPSGFNDVLLKQNQKYADLVSKSKS